MKTTWRSIPAQVWLFAIAILASQSALVAQPIPGRYVAVLKPETSDVPDMARALAAQHGVTADHIYTKAIKGFAFAGSDSAAKALARRAEVAYVEPDQVYTAFQQTVPTGIRRCDAEAVPGLITGGNVTIDADVAVIDTGLDATHPDLNVVPQGVRFYMPKNRLVTDTNWMDDNGHGTHVGGTIGARDNNFGVVGVAPGVRLWPVKVLNSSGSGPVSVILAGIDWVVQRAGTFEVANMSLGGGFSQAMNDAVKAGTQAGIVFVVAAGNSADNAANYSPASEPTALTVSALGDNDGIPGGLGGITVENQFDDSLAWFSNYGELVDVCAPGVSIPSTYLMSRGGYATNSGTSMAAPHVAGAAALYIARHGQEKNAAGVEAVCAAIRNSGWQAGHYACFDDYLYYEGVFDAFAEPLLNVAKLVYWQSPPALVLSSPGDAAKVNGTVMIGVAANVPAANAVQFYLDGQLLGQDSDGSDGWSITWNSAAAADGVRTLVAIATDGVTQLAGDAVVIGVNNSGGVGPSVRITQPAYFPYIDDGWFGIDLGYVPISGNVSLQAEASDMVPVAGVDFYCNDTRLGAGTPGTNGWSLDWDTTQWPDSTNNTLWAVATAADGSQGISVGYPVGLINQVIHVGDFKTLGVAEGGGKWSATVWITVHRSTHEPLPGATVLATWYSRPRGITVSSSAVTDVNGTCSFKLVLGSKYYGVDLYVDNVLPPADQSQLHYERVFNHDPDGSPPPADYRVVVSKP